MKITVVFDSLEEFMQHMTTGVIASEPVRTFYPAEAVTASEWASAETNKLADAEPEEPAEVPAATTEEPKEAPTYVLADAQKAVREVVKKKGKDAAKDILSHYRHKDKEDSPATGASALRPADYAAAIRELEEALNG